VTVIAFRNKIKSYYKTDNIVNYLTCIIFILGGLALLIKLIQDKFSVVNVSSRYIVMKITRIRFVFPFLIFASAFLFGTTLLLDQPPESLWGSESQIAWKSVVATILSPIKIILIGPLLPFIKFLHQDPDTPPPFFLVGFVFYWTILALIIHYVLSKIKHLRRLFPSGRGRYRQTVQQ